MKNTIVKRNLPSNFSKVDNDIWTDMNLSGDGLRVLGYLLSRPDGWVIRESDIRKQFAQNGKELASNHFYRKTIKNLQDAGYLRKVAIRNEAGQIIEWTTELSDSPIFKDQAVPDVEIPTPSPDVEKPDVEKPLAGFTTCGEFTPLNKTYSSSKIDSSKTDVTPAIDSDPLPKQWADEADIKDAIRTKRALYKIMCSEIKKTNTRRTKFPEFVKTHPEAKPEDVIFWCEREWPKHKYFDGNKPPIGTLINEFKMPPSADEQLAFDTIDDFISGNHRMGKPPKWVVDAYKKSGIKLSGLSKSQIPQVRQEIFKHATVTV